MKFFIIGPKGFCPIKKTMGSAGYDLYASEDTVINSNFGLNRGLVKTDLKVVCEPNTYVRIAARSSQALEKGVIVGGGVVDSDYIGEVQVLLFNLGGKPLEIKRGDAIAQMIFEEMDTSPIRACKFGAETDFRMEREVELKPRVGGFGSTN